MNDKIKSNYESIKKAILNNLATIRSLAEQAECLREIAESINDSKSDQKDKLEKTVKSIEDNLNNLATETENLFNIYYDFITKL